MYRRFDFEGDIHVTLLCVPLTVRRKLDLAGLKISLSGWQTLSREERLSLCHLPVESEEELGVYRDVLRGFAQRADVPLKPLAEEETQREGWSREALSRKLAARLGDGFTLEPARLAALTEEERYALVKLSDPKREPDKLLRALSELGLYQAGR